MKELYTFHLTQEEMKLAIEAIDYLVGLMQGNDQEQTERYKHGITLEEKLLTTYEEGANK